ncbi:MAG: MFS transporter [Marinosulfonomonas sp.]|nr:MFS transporter [Marinosulfonomonas sp.]
MNTSGSEETGLPYPRRIWAVVTVVTSIILLVASTAAISLGLPVIADDLDIEAATAVWIVSAFQISLVVSILPCSALGEMLGHRRIYRSGIMIFTIGAALCAVSDNFGVLLAARALQGIGGAATVSVGSAILRDIYPRSKVGTAVSINALTVAVSGGVGPIAGSLVLSYASWPYLFSMWVPIGMIAYFASAALPDNEAGRGRMDVLGALINAVAFGSLVLGVTQLGSRLDLALPALAISCIAFVFLTIHVRGKPHSILPVDLLAMPRLRMALTTSGLGFATGAVIMTVFPFYLLRDIGITKIEAGFVVAIWPTTAAVSAVLAGWMSDRIRPEILCFGGLLTMAICLLLIISPMVGHSIKYITYVMAVMGVGFGFFQAPNNRILIVLPPRERRIRASGLQATSREFGNAIGIGLVGLGFSLAATGGAYIGLVAGAALAVLATILSAVRLNRGLWSDL